MKENDFGPFAESTPDVATSTQNDENNGGSGEPEGEESADVRGDVVVGSIRYVSCSVAGSDPEDHPHSANATNHNENEGIFWFSIHFEIEQLKKF